MLELVDCYPTHATYRPGQAAQICLHLRRLVLQPLRGQLRLHLLFGADRVDSITSEFTLTDEEQRLSVSLSLPPDDGRGYGVEAELLDAAGRTLARGSTALDVLSDWTMAPRYGFLSDFVPGENDADETMAWLARHHINGLQFYDWMYRHDRLVAPAEPYVDPLGRRLSKARIDSLIRAARARNIATMAYAAVYAASVPFAQVHPDWRLFDAEGQPLLFGDDFLVIMNPAPGSPWTGHLMAEFQTTLREMGFDGIHIDQYGDPKVGFDSAGQPVDLPEAFRAFVDQTKATLGAEVPALFNTVGNWPIEALVRSQQNFPYIEVWPPQTAFHDLWSIIVAASQGSGGKPVVLAAYIPPTQPHNVRLANAVILASGGTHIELGERERLLADPYFPKHEPIDDALARVLRRVYDFAVRYENLLVLDTEDVTQRDAAQVSIEGVAHPADGAPGTIWTLVRQSETRTVLHLINLTDLPHARWTELLPHGPTPLSELHVSFRTARSVTRVWWASPDGAALGAAPLPFDVVSDEPARVGFVLPRLDTWTMVVLESPPTASFRTVVVEQGRKP